MCDDDVEELILYNHQALYLSRLFLLGTLGTASAVSVADALGHVRHYEFMNGKLLLPKMQSKGSMFRTNHYLAAPINPPTESPSSQYRYQRLNHLMDTFLASRQGEEGKDKNEVIIAITRMLRDTEPGHPTSSSSPVLKAPQSAPQTIFRSFQKQSWSKRMF